MSGAEIVVVILLAGFGCAIACCIAPVPGEAIDRMVSRWLATHLTRDPIQVAAEREVEALLGNDREA